MSKKYKGKTCVYCGHAESTGADHVFAREFFLLRDRDALPKVPSCSRCNGRKSELEHYAVTVLPFGGRHPSAKENLETMVPGRLAKNVRLHRDLSAGQGKTQGSGASTMTLPVDGERIQQLFGLIVRGLLWHHWSVRVQDSDSVDVTMLTPEGERFFEQRFFQLGVGDRVNVDLGSGTIGYEGMCVSDGGNVISVWRISLFGGVMTTDSNDMREGSSLVGVVTGPGDDRALTRGIAVGT